MRVKILIGLLLLCSLTADSQTYFNQFWDFAGYAVSTGKVVETEDHFLVFAIIGGDRYVAQKFSKLGQLQSSKTLLEGDVAGWEHAGTAIPLEDGNFLVGISLLLDSAEREFVVFIIDENANILNSRGFAGPAFSSWEYITQISQTSDGGFLLSGSSSAVDSLGNLIEDADVIAIKTNAQLDVEWQRLYSKYEIANQEQLFLNYTHIEMPNGNFLLGCHSCEYLSPGTCVFGSRVLVLMEISSEDGAVQNEAIIDDDEYQHAPYLVPLDEEHFLLAHIGPISNEFQQSGNFWKYKKYSYTGELVWEKSYANEEEFYYWNRSAIYSWPVVLSNQSFLQLFQFEDYIIGQNGDPNQWGLKSAIAVFDSLGNWINTKVIERDTSELVYEGMYDFEKTMDGGYILAGRRRPQRVPPVASQGWLVKLDSSLQLCSGWPCDSIADFPVSNVGSLSWLQEQQITVFPNPASSQLTFSFDSPPDAIQSLLILGVDGKILLRRQVLPGERQVAIPVIALSEGIGLWELRQDGILLSTGKFMIEH